MTNIIAIEQERMPASRRQLLLHQVGDGRLARAGQAGEPQHSRTLALELGVGFAADVEVLAVDVEGPPKREMQHPARDGRIRQLVDQDEAAERSVRTRALGRIGLKYDLAVGRDLDNATAVQLQRLRGEMLERVDAD